MSKRKIPPYNEAQINHWLVWLAKNMQRDDQTVFLIEYLQPNWLQTGSGERLYAVSTRTIWGLWVGLIGGLIGTLFFAPIADSIVKLVFGLKTGLNTIPSPKLRS